MTTSPKPKKTIKPVSEIDQKINDLAKSIVNSDSYQGAADAQYLIKQLSKRVIEAMLQGEMSAHLESEKQAEDPVNAPDVLEPPIARNKRNGTSSKTLKTEQGSMEVAIPRDRNGTFEPILLPKHVRRFGKIDEQIIAMYSRGMSTRDIEAFVRDMYGVDISPDYVSAVTECVLEDMERWQNRPLQGIYPVVFFDAMRIKIRHGAIVKNMAVHIALGIQVDGQREVLGLWIAENEGASFWASIFTSLKARGVEDILLAVTDGLKGMNEALESVFPEALHQTCIVHLIRASTIFVPQKDRKAVCDALKPIYQAVDASEAEKALERFKESAIGKRYTVIASIWERAWAQVIPFFNFAPEIRTLIYTTNSIEGLNRAIRKVIKTRTLFPNEDAAKKLVYLAIKNFTAGWSRPNIKWSAAMPQFAALFGERFTAALK